jgi:hypothetical protein
MSEYYSLKSSLSAEVKFVCERNIYFQRRRIRKKFRKDYRSSFGFPSLEKTFPSMYFHLIKMNKKNMQTVIFSIYFPS